jgi:hypothetical protein
LFAADIIVFAALIGCMKRFTHWLGGIIVPYKKRRAVPRKAEKSNNKDRKGSDKNIRRR